MGAGTAECTNWLSYPHMTFPVQLEDGSLQRRIKDNINISYQKQIISQKKKHHWAPTVCQALL